jgi:hypothetical protein
MTPHDKALVSNVRERAGLPEGQGPDDSHVLAGIRGFVEAFDYWYIRVVRGAVLQYRKLVVARINPFIRRVELDGLSAHDAAQRLVEDYARRNFVTAGGWALEELAIASSETMQKSAAAGMDAQRLDPTTSEYHLYVLKSGLVTRNSDIVKAIKSHSRQAERLLRQGRGTSGVHLNYAILAGKTSSTFEDGVRRPSSAEFWSEALGLPQPEALELVLAMAAEAGRLVTSDASVHVEAMVTLIRRYIAKDDGSGEVDWDFIAKRTMRVPSDWKAEDRVRHLVAMTELRASGYQVSDTQDAAATAQVVADLEPHRSN